MSNHKFQISAIVTHAFHAIFVAKCIRFLNFLQMYLRFRIHFSLCLHQSRHTALYLDENVLLETTIAPLRHLHIKFACIFRIWLWHGHHFAHRYFVFFWTRSVDVMFSKSTTLLFAFDTKCAFQRMLLPYLMNKTHLHGKCWYSGKVGSKANKVRRLPHKTLTYSSFFV